MSKKKNGIEKTARVLQSAKLMFEKKLMVFENNQVKLYSLLIDKKDKKFKNSYFSNIYLYCVVNKLVKKGDEIVFIDIETDEILGYCSDTEVYF